MVVKVKMLGRRHQTTLGRTIDHLHQSTVHQIRVFVHIIFAISLLFLGLLTEYINTFHKLLYCQNGHVNSHQEYLKTFEEHRPGQYWENVEKHKETTLQPIGGWVYNTPHIRGTHTYTFTNNDDIPIWQCMFLFHLQWSFHSFPGKMGEGDNQTLILMLRACEKDRRSKLLRDKN